MEPVSIYIGAAIDAAQGDPKLQFEALMKGIQEVLGGRAVIFSPFNAFNGAAENRSPETNFFVVNINQTALVSATLAVFIWSDSPSFGVPLEINTCNEESKRFIIWDKSTKTPGIYLQSIVEKSNGFGALVKTQEELAKALLDAVKAEQEHNKPTPLKEKAVHPEALNN